MVDVEAVDLLHGRDAHRDTRGARADLHRQRGSRRRVQALGIVHARDLGLGREHHRGGDHRAREGRHARLVHARDVAHARLPEHALEVAHRIQAQPLVALALEALAQRGVQALHALALVALQAIQDLLREGLLAFDETAADLVDRKLFDTGHERASRGMDHSSKGPGRGTTPAAA